MRVMSNQGSRSDMIQVEAPFIFKDSRGIKRNETHLCSIAADESCLISPESLLLESSSSLGNNFCQDANVLHRNSHANPMSHEFHVPPSCANDDKSCVHSLYDGIDISFNNDSDNESVCGDTNHTLNCSGRRKVFQVSNCADLTESEVNTRFKMDFDGVATFIQCTSLCFNRRQLRGSLFVYQMNKSKIWRLGIVESFNYNMNGNSDDTLSFYEWKGACTSVGCPKMFECTNFDELTLHLKHRMFCINDVNAYFVNQVCVILC
jgi:hypothetical protein